MTYLSNPRNFYETSRNLVPTIAEAFLRQNPWFRWVMLNRSHHWEILSLRWSSTLGLSFSQILATDSPVLSSTDFKLSAPGGSQRTFVFQEIDRSPSLHWSFQCCRPNLGNKRPQRVKFSFVVSEDPYSSKTSKGILFAYLSQSRWSMLLPLLLLVHQIVPQAKTTLTVLTRNKAANSLLGFVKKGQNCHIRLLTSCS